MENIAFRYPNFLAYFYSRFIVDHHDLKSNFQVGCINY